MQDWRSIVERHGALVWQTAYRLLADESDTADCFQETFLAALQMSRRQRVRNMEALLTHLATRRAIDRLRLRIRRNQRECDVEDRPELAAAAGDPLSQAQDHELAEQLTESLGRLPEQEAEVFCLRYVSGMSYRQIAKEMNIKTTNAGVILHRARAKLRQMLDPTCREKCEVDHEQSRR